MQHQCLVVGDGLGVRLAFSLHVQSEARGAVTCIEVAHRLEYRHVKYVNHIMASSPKQNITVAIDKRLLKAARVLAARRSSSISALLADGLRQMTDNADTYRSAKSSALALLRQGLRLGGKGVIDREALHDRKGLR